MSMQDKVKAYVRFCQLRNKLDKSRDKDKRIGKQEAIIYARQMFTTHLRWHKKGE